MKKILILLILIICIGLSSPLGIAAQSSPNQSAEFIFNSKKEEFATKAPCVFSETASEKAWSIYKCRSGNNWFFITSTTEESTSQLKEIKQQSPSEITVSNHKYGSYEGLIYMFADHDGNFQKVLTISTSSRFYIFHTISELADDPQTKAFLQSVGPNILTKFVREKTTSSKTILGKLRNPAADPKYMTRERAFLMDALKDSQVFVPKPDQTTPLKILRTVQPGYTPLAVLYEIEGVVQVRTTLLDSGRVGTVTPVKKLPLGLTANAIAAAKFVRFEPKVEKGVPMTIIKTIEYEFAIY